MDLVGDRIRDLRKEKRWTQVMLAEKVNVSPQVVSNWERNYTDPDHDDIARLAKVFDESADYILGRSKTRNLKGENNEVDEPEYVRLFKKLSPEKRKLILELLEGYVDK